MVDATAAAQHHTSRFIQCREPQAERLSFRIERPLGPRASAGAQLPRDQRRPRLNRRRREDACSCPRCVWALLPPPPLRGGPASGLRARGQTRAPPTSASCAAMALGTGVWGHAVTWSHGRGHGSEARPAVPTAFLGQACGSGHFVWVPWLCQPFPRDRALSSPRAVPTVPDIPTVGLHGPACLAYFSVK